MTPQELKNSILQLAIQGKLVEQRPEEGTAEELYRQIQEEKWRLVKEGKIKKEKPLPEIAEDEVPFEIPASWKWVRIGQVFGLQAGKNITAADIYDQKSSEHCYPCYGGNGLRGFVSVYNREGHFALIGRQGALCGNINFADGRFYATEHAVVVDHYGLSDTIWSGYFLRALNLNQYATATAQPGLAVANIIKIPIPLPPLAEQKRIITKIEELLPYIDRYRQAWGRLDVFNKRFPVDMQKSLLQWAIQGKLVEQRPEEGTAEELYRQIQEEKQRLVKEGKIKKEKPLPEITEDEVPFEIPKSWKWVKLGDVLREVIVPMRDKPAFSKEGIPWCRIEDRDGFLLNGSKSNQLVSDETIRNMNLKVFPVGTVLSACTGGSIGTIIINTIECCTNQTFNGLVCSSGLHNWYLFWYLKTQFNALRKVGTGTTIAYVSQKKSKEMLLPLPPLAEQKRIVAKLEELLPLCERLK